MKNRSILEVIIDSNFIERALRSLGRRIGKLHKLLGRWILSKQTTVEPKKVIFMTYQNNFSCNPKYIAQELLRQNVDCDIVWVVGKKEKIEFIKENYPEGIRFVNRGTYEFFKEIGSAKIWIDNSLNFMWDWFPKKPEQIYFETWHGSMGIKRIGAGDVKNKRWTRTAKRCNKYMNYCISNSDFETDVYKENHWSEVEILKYGHPRNDLLLSSDPSRLAELRKSIYERYEIDSNKRILLYAPTFREQFDYNCYDVDYDRVLEALKTRFGGEWVVFMRNHFHDRNNIEAEYEVESIENLVNVTSYADMQELIAISDIALSDYSSWMYDFVITKRPGFLFATDLDSYNNERGLYFKLETTPFPVATDNDELVNNILNFDEDLFLKRADEFLFEKGSVEDGHASERVVEKIKEIIR